MVHARFLEAYIHFASMYTTYHSFLVILIKDLIKKLSGRPHHLNLVQVQTLQYNFYAGYFPCVVRKANAHVDKNALNMCHQVKKGFCGIFVVIKQHQKGSHVYISSKRKIIFSYDVIFDESFLVRLNISHNLMQSQWLCIRLCNT